MKHIFWIHSSITYLISQSVIQYLQIKDKDVLFLSARSYKPIDCKYLICDCTAWLTWYSPLRVKSILKHNSYTSIIDTFLTEKCHGESFCAYIPSTSIIPCQIIVTNKFCGRYSIIEEGIANYRFSLYKLPAINRGIIVKMVTSLLNCFFKRIQLNHSFLGSLTLLKVKPFYYYFENAFHEKQQNHIYLSFPNSSITKKYDYSGNLIFIHSSLLENHFCKYSDLKYIYEFIAHCASEKRLMYVKYHPNQSLTSRQLFENCLLEQNIPFVEIANEVPMEFVIANSISVEYWGFESSLLFYAKMFNRKSVVKSFSYRLADKSKIYSRCCSKYSDLFSDIQQL